MTKIKTTPSSSSTHTSHTSAPRSPSPAPTTPKTTAPKTTTPPSGGDGFAKAKPSSSGPVNSTHQAQPTPSKMPGGKDVTADFGKDPKTFASHHVLNAYNTSPPSGLPLPTPSATFVPASQSMVTVNAHQRPGGNANLTFGPAGGQGVQAHYLHYLSEGEGRFAGISGVPPHPTANAPTTIVTGPLNGCAVHAFHDKNTQTMSFVHHANYSKNGENELKDFLKQNPNLQHAATLGPADYSHRTGHGDEATGATAMLHYDKPTQPGQQGQWSIIGQLNDWKSGAGPDARPELKRPDFNAPPFLQIPIPPPKAE